MAPCSVGFEGHGLPYLVLTSNCRLRPDVRNSDREYPLRMTDMTDVAMFPPVNLRKKRNNEFPKHESGLSAYSAVNNRQGRQTKTA